MFDVSVNDTPVIHILSHQTHIYSATKPDLHAASAEEQVANAADTGTNRTSCSVIRAATPRLNSMS